MGDSYAGSRRGGDQNSDSITRASSRDEHRRKRAKVPRWRATSGGGPQAQQLQVPRSDLAVPGLKPKDLMGQPWRLAFALQADGWWNRCDVIWHKPNPMPESADDRPTKAHEYLFLLSKSERYYYDADAIKEPASPDTHARYARGRSDAHKWAGEGSDARASASRRSRAASSTCESPWRGWANGSGSHAAIDHAKQIDGLTRDGKLLIHPKVEQRPDGAYEDGKGERMGRGPGWRRKLAQDRDAKSNESFDAALCEVVGLRNKRSVWQVATEGFPGAHFATFPTKLIEPCILAGCPEGGEVLDCFGGSATTGLVADRLGRNALLCELNEGYAGMGETRIAGDRGHVSRQRGMELGDD
jgi:hypothetical protein